MKRLLKNVLGLALSLVIALPVHAQIKSDIQAPKDVTGTTYPVVQTEHSSRMTGVARGRVISSGSVGLTDNGNGVFSVYADTSCHSAVKDIHMRIYLDIWNDDTEDWDTLTYYDYKWSAKSAEEDLHTVMVTFEIHDLTRGREYQLRGSHVAEDFDGIIEGMASRTQTLKLS